MKIEIFIFIIIIVLLSYKSISLIPSLVTTIVVAHGRTRTTIFSLTIISHPHHGIVHIIHGVVYIIVVISHHIVIARIATHQIIILDVV